MKPKERVYSTLAGKPVDRPAAMPITMMWAADLIGVPYKTYATSAETQARGQIETARVAGFDHVSVISDPCCEAADLGAAIYYPDDAPPAVIEESALLSDTAALARLRPCDPHRAGSRMANRVQAVRLLREQIGDTHLIEGWIEGPCAESADLRGINTLMTDYFDDEDFVHDLAAFAVDNAIRFAKAQLEAGADIIGIGDAAASLVGPAIYDEFVLPHERRLVEAIHALGGRVRLHICGNTTPLLAGMGSLGCAIVDLDTSVDMGQARDIMGPSQVLLGNVHTVNTVKNGTPADVLRELEACRAKTRRAWIAGAGCEIPRGSPLANVKVFAALEPVSGI
ncbi:MAG: uroporphyrinogen decarboxylase family protein [Oceanipulchritudo sp.]